MAMIERGTISGEMEVFRFFKFTNNFWISEKCAAVLLGEGISSDLGDSQEEGSGVQKLRFGILYGELGCGEYRDFEKGQNRFLLKRKISEIPSAAP